MSDEARYTWRVGYTSRTLDGITFSRPRAVRHDGGKATTYTLEGLQRFRKDALAWENLSARELADLSVTEERLLELPHKVHFIGPPTVEAWLEERQRGESP